MSWGSPFVIFRISPEGRLEQVYQAEDLKSAKYWLTYIAQTGDVLCKTPLHPKHSKSSNRPEYWSHKEASGTLLARQEEWHKFTQALNCGAEFPEHDSTQSVPAQR